MERAFFPGAGFGPGPFFNPFFVPRRQFFPFFFLSPFGFPFFRGEDDRDGMYHMKHHCKEGDTLDSLAQTYNCPRPILEAMNPHIQHPHYLAAGTVVHIPRLDQMVCHKLYLEQEVYDERAAYPGYADPKTGS
jgi:hypothetical protein